MNIYHTLDSFTQAYCIAALWTSEPDELGQPGDFEPRGREIVERLPNYWLEQAKADCERFQAENETLLEQAGDDSQNGHDFWLTRNRHGAGFWDRGYPDEIGDALKEASQKFGEAWLDWEELAQDETEA